LLGWFELVATAVIVSYVAVAALQALRARGADVDFALLSVAAVLLLFGFFGPIKYLNSICLNTRFVPYGAMLLMLALPAPRLRVLELGFGAFALAFSLYTTLIWTLFDQEDMSGLGESLAAVSEPKSVLGLNFRPHAETVAGNPFLQTFAYFQAERGGELNFSFAQHGSGVVAYRTPRVMRWTPNLEWDARPVTARDLALFDCALVNAPAAIHLAFQKQTGLRTSVREGYFRLYCH
jgi:hypothetical protein